MFCQPIFVCCLMCTSQFKFEISEVISSFNLRFLALKPSGFSFKHIYLSNPWKIWCIRLLNFWDIQGCFMAVLLYGHGLQKYGHLDVLGKAVKYIPFWSIGYQIIFFTITYYSNDMENHILKSNNRIICHVPYQLRN